MCHYNHRIETIDFHVFSRDVTHLPVRFIIVIIILPSTEYVIHAAVQPARQAAAAEVVHGVSGQDEEEDHPRTRHHNPGTQTQDVLVPGVEGLQDCLQEVP